MRRKVLRKSMGIETVGDPKEVEAIDIVSTSSGHRTSVSGQITHFAPRNVEKADKGKFQLDASNSLCTSTKPVENALSNPNESNNESFTEEVTSHVNSQSNEHILPEVSIVSVSNLEPMLTIERITSVRSSSPISYPSQLPFKKKFFGTFQKPLVEVSESEASLSSCSTRINKRHFSDYVQICSPSLRLSACSPTKTSLTPEDPFCFIEEDDKIGKYERVGAGVKDNFQAPTTKEHKKRMLYTPGKDDLVHSDHEDSPSHSSVRQNHEVPVKCNRSLKEKKGKCILDLLDNEPLTKTNISWIKCDYQPASRKFSRKSTRLKKKVNYKDMSSSEIGVGFGKPHSSGKLSSSSSGRVEPLRSERLASSPPLPLGSAPISVDVDPVNLSPPHYPAGTCEPEPLQISPPPHMEMVCLQSPVNQKIKKNRSSRNKRNACVNNEVKRRRNKKRPDIESTAVPSTVLSDEKVVTEDRQKHVVAPQCPVQIVTCSSEATADMHGLRRQGSGNVKSLKYSSQAIESSVLFVDTTEEAGPQAAKFRVCPPHSRATPSPAVQPFFVGSDMLKQNEVNSVSSKAPFSPCYSSHVQQGNGDANLHSRIGTVGDQIWSEIKTYMNGVKSENTPIMESVKVNLSTCLATHKAVMNTIQEESLNIARSAANVRSACEKGMASFDVVLEMLNVIDEFHRDTTVAASVRNNDPRTYSQLRQRIYKLINEALPPNPHEE